MNTDIIYNRDCLEGLKELPDNCIDLVIADPPYYFGENFKGADSFGHRQNYRDIEELNEPLNYEVLEECLRVLKAPNLYIWTNKTQLGAYISFFESKGCKTDLLTWHKRNPTPATSNNYLSDTEYCLFFRKGAPLYGTYDTKKKYWITATNQKEKAKYDHPTIKPLSIIKQLIINSTQGGGLVIDPYMGSGTTALACKMLGRHYIGFEIEPKYCELASKRLKDVSGLDAWFTGGA